LDLPAHERAGGFDHAAVHRASSQLYVAHTANNALDVIDCNSDRYLRSIPNLTGIAGALISDEHNLVFTSNRGEDTVGIFQIGEEQKITKIKVGIHPNGLSFDPKRGLLLAANVGDPDIAGSFSVSIVNVVQKKLVSSIPVAGRTRWTIFDPATECFYINLADPFQIAVVESAHPTRVARWIEIQSQGPHGLDFDPATNRLFCACDAGKLFAVDTLSGKILLEAELTGAPDVIFFNSTLKHLYVAVGDPGVIDLFDTDSLTRIDMVSTEKGAHTIGFNATHNKVYAFLSESQRAGIYFDRSL
ncbi:MAG TPA: YncE family protein, partial [Anaerolineales bacterium]|nr:YncE family protein [Anaerolineales bacterium]